MIAYLIPADPAQECREIRLPRLGQEIAQALDCDWYELVRHEWLAERRMVMLVDEEGLLNRREPNARATFAFYPHGFGIVGPALILAEIDTHEGPDIGGLSAFQVNALADLPALAVAP